MRCAISLVGTALVLGAAMSHAQSHAPAVGDRYLSTSYAASFATNSGPHFALVRHRPVLQSAVQAEWVTIANRAVAFSTTMEAVVAVLLPYRDARTNECFENGRRCFPVSRPRVPVAALGGTPVGFKLYVAPDAPVRLFGSVAGGFIAFDRSTPVIAASAVNFAAEYVLGAEFVRPTGAALSVAWKFQHWSNGGTAYLNPGIDANLLYVSFKRQRK